MVYSTKNHSFKTIHMKEKLKSVSHGREHFSKSSRITSGTLSKGEGDGNSVFSIKKQVGGVATHKPYEK